MAKISSRPGVTPVAAPPVQLPPIVQPPPPMVNAINPAQGQAGDRFDLVGSGLSATSEVRFRNNAGTQFRADIVNETDTDITAIVPQVDPGTYKVAALDKSGVPIANVQTYTVVAGKAPSFDPNDPFEQCSGKVGDRVIIRGKHLAPVTEIDFNGVSARVNHIDSQTLQTKVPNGATTGFITLVSPNGTATSPKKFVVATGPPTVGSFSPTAGPPGTKIVVTGTQLLGVCTVKFGSLPDFNFTPVKEHELDIIVPNASPGTYTVTISSGAGDARFSFTVTAH